jgi:hypothetical protein
MAKQVLLAHMSQHALMVDHIAAILKFCCDPPVAIIRELQSDFLNLIIQIRIFAILRGDLFGWLHPFIIAAAAYFQG